MGNIKMKWINNLFGELVVYIITFVIGIHTMNDVLYNHYLNKSYWKAFIFSPYRFIKYNGNAKRL